MGIKCTISKKAFKAFFDTAVKELAEQINFQLNYLGQECVTRIRKKEGTVGWNDQTGNLRSSIGAGVINKGKKKLQAVFEQVLGGVDGVKAGQKYLDQLVKQYAETYALVVVAGMEYASYVEDMENKDVLVSTRLWAELQIDKYLNDAAENSAVRINNMQL